MGSRLLLPLLAVVLVAFASVVSSDAGGYAAVPPRQLSGQVDWAFPLLGEVKVNSEQNFTDPEGSEQVISNYASSVTLKPDAQAAWSANGNSHQETRAVDGTKIEATDCQGSGSAGAAPTKHGVFDLPDPDGGDDPPYAHAPWQTRGWNMVISSGRQDLAGVFVELHRDGSWRGQTLEPEPYAGLGAPVSGNCTTTFSDGTTQTHAADTVPGAPDAADLWQTGSFRWTSQPQTLSGDVGETRQDTGATVQVQWNLRMFCEAIAADSDGAWWGVFPQSTETRDLAQPFRGRVEDFLSVLRAHKNVHVTIITTYRPRERSYLMHYAFRIAVGSKYYPRISPTDVPDYTGPGGFEHVPICWVHRHSDGTPDIAKSVAAAKRMVSMYAYNINKHGPALRSRHNDHLAIDVQVNWTGPLTLPLGPLASHPGSVTLTAGGNDDDLNGDFHDLAATYGLIWSNKDPHHFSDNGS